LLTVFGIRKKVNAIIYIPDDQEGLFKLSLIKNIFYSAIYNTATGYVL
jgi:hypothetical protein